MFIISDKNGGTKVYTNYADLGLTATSFSATDFGANIKLLLDKMNNGDKLVQQGLGTNFVASIDAYTGYKGDIYWALELTRLSSTAIPNPFYLYPNAGAGIAKPTFFGTYDNDITPCRQIATTATYTATITTTWSGTAAPFTQDIAIAGILAADSPIVDLILSSNAKEGLNEQDEWGKVTRITTAANKITVYCYKERPKIPLNIQLKVVR